MNRSRFGGWLGAAVLGCSLVAGVASASGPARLATGKHVAVSAAEGWSFRLHGVPAGQRYEYRVTGRGRVAVQGSGVVGSDPHAQAVDLGPFRRGEIRVRVTLIDAAGDPARSMTGTVWKDPAYPAGYL